MQREVDVLNTRELLLHTDKDITILELVEVCKVFLDNGKKIKLELDNDDEKRTICRLGVRS
jgi:hypothetical protein